MSWKNLGGGRWVELRMHLLGNNRSFLGSMQTALTQVNKQYTEPLMKRLIFFISEFRRLDTAGVFPLGSPPNSHTHLVRELSQTIFQRGWTAKISWSLSGCILKEIVTR